MTELDRLIGIARQDLDGSPPPTSKQQASRAAMVRRAVIAGRARHQKSQERRLVVGVVSMLALAAVVLLAMRFWPAPISEYALDLPTGDHLLATSDVRFTVESQTSALRRVRLTEGAILFDVAPLGPGSVFEVLTESETVRVLGTVFVVEVADARTSVRVYEGRVEVVSRTGRTVLGAGERYQGSVATERSASLEAAGVGAAARRTRAAPVRERDAARGSVVVRSAASAASAANELDGELDAASDVEAGPARGARRRSVAPAVDARPVPSAPAASVASAPSPETPPETPPETTVPPPSPAEPMLTSEEAVRQAREALRVGDAERALALSRSAHGDDPALFFVEADALRMLGRAQAAAQVYERVVDHRLQPPARRRAGFLAAELWYRRLHDPRRATSVLLRSGALDDPSPTLRERALALRAELAEATEDRAALAEAVRAYLAAHPDGPRAAWMRARE